MPIRFLDLFAGAGGLSEGFIQEGYEPVAHVEMDSAACYTLRTRVAFHYLKNSQGGQKLYTQYLNGQITRAELYDAIPPEKLNSVIHRTIDSETIDDIFKTIDTLNGKQDIDLIVGGPPCQAYSLAGRSRTGKDKIKTDSRNYLFEYYVAFLRRYHPRCFIFENVLGLETAKDEKGNKFKDLMFLAFQEAGYIVQATVYKAEEYGVPQKRRRLIIVGIRNDEAYVYPLALPEPLSISISKLLGDLRSLQADAGTITGEKQRKHPHPWLIRQQISDSTFPITWHKSRYHNERDKEIYRMAVKLWQKEHRPLNYATDVPVRLQTHKNLHSFTDRFKVVPGDEMASHTVVAHISKDGHYYIHPDISQNRSLTPREAARLQTFPDNYFFESPSDTRKSAMYAYRQIGNAVPVVLARKIAHAVRRHIFKDSQ